MNLYILIHDELGKEFAMFIFKTDMFMTRFKFGSCVTWVEPSVTEIGTSSLVVVRTCTKIFFGGSTPR